MPKSTKRFILSNDSLNEAGGRVITSGVDLSYFKSNPQLYWVLDFSLGNMGTASLAGSLWVDIQNNGKEISAVPFFNDSDPLAMKVYNAVEHGSIRAVNVIFDYLEFDTNVSNWKRGQKLPTVIKSKIKQVSLSTGLDRGETATLIADNNVICLKLPRYNTTHLSNTSIKNMETKTTPENSFDNLPPATQAILKNAVEAGKFTQDTIDSIVKLSTNDPSVLTTLKDVIRKAKIKPDLIEGKYHPAYIKKAAEKTFDQIGQNGDPACRDLMANAPELYKAKYFEKYGELPYEKNGKIGLQP